MTDLNDEDYMDGLIGQCPACGQHHFNTACPPAVFGPIEPPNYGHWSTVALALKAMTKERDDLILQVAELKKFIESVHCDHGCELAPFEMSYHLPGCVVTRRKAILPDKPKAETGRLSNCRCGHLESDHEHEEPMERTCTMVDCDCTNYRATDKRNQDLSVNGCKCPCHAEIVKLGMGFPCGEGECSDCDK